MNCGRIWYSLVISLESGLIDWGWIDNITLIFYREIWQASPNGYKNLEIFFSSIVKIRRALVQLKQFKKIKHLQECNFPHFTSESKYQMKAHIWKYEMLHNIPVCTAFILSDPSPIIELPCYPLSPSSCWILRKLLDLSKWIWQIDKWISPSHCMDWLYGFANLLWSC